MNETGFYSHQHGAGGASGVDDFGRSPVLLTGKQFPTFTINKSRVRATK